ncbi:MAG: type IV toxin-antitoxin system AbiEi family antitoxin domain-containing protein [Lachnospiraceae bacterium]
MPGIPSKQQFIPLQSLKDEGLSLYKINQLVRGGKLAKVTRSYYENREYDGEINDFYSVPAYTDDRGVVCLLSAAAYYGMTTQRPPQVNVALPRASRIPGSPDWPPMRFYLFSEARYRTGLEKITRGSNAFYIYDREKTVCDVLFYRSKLGFEPAIEVIRNYMNTPDRNLNRLMRYAEALRVKTVVRQYVEVLQ